MHFRVISSLLCRFKPHVNAAHRDVESRGDQSRKSGYRTNSMQAKAGRELQEDQPAAEYKTNPQTDRETG